MPDEEQIKDLRAHGFNDQPHYSDEVRRLLLIFQFRYQTWLKMRRRDWNESKVRASLAQDAWYELARARKRETGVAYYLTPDQYAKQVNGNAC